MTRHNSKLVTVYILVSLSLIVLVGFRLHRWANQGYSLDEYAGFDILKAVVQPQDPGGPVADEDDVENGIANSEKEYGPLIRQRELEAYSSADTLRCDGPKCPYNQATLPGSRGYKGSFFPIDSIKNPETGGPIEEDEELVKAMIQDMSKKPCIKLCMEMGVHLPQLAACSKDCRDLKREKVQSLISQLNHQREINRWVSSPLPACFARARPRAEASARRCCRTPSRRRGDGRVTASSHGTAEQEGGGG
jgi:hypothetical protein